MYVFDLSEKEVIGGPITLEDDDPVTKYRAASDGRTFWAYNRSEVFYEDERMYAALDEIEHLRGDVHLLIGAFWAAYEVCADEGIGPPCAVVELVESLETKYGPKPLDEEANDDA
jgi:hypothetical protein